MGGRTPRIAMRGIEPPKPSRVLQNGRHRRHGARDAANMVSLTLSPGGCTAVMGIKERLFSPLPRGFSLEGLVPKDNFYRRLEQTLDLSFVRDFFDYCREHDVLVVARLVRLGRSFRELIHLVRDLENSGVGVAKAVFDYVA